MLDSPAAPHRLLPPLALAAALLLAGCGAQDSAPPAPPTGGMRRSALTREPLPAPGPASIPPPPAAEPPTTPARTTPALTPAVDRPADPVAAMAVNLSAWRSLARERNRRFDPLESLDFDANLDRLTVTPRPNAWYESFEGGLLFQELSGDWIASTSVELTDRAGQAAPGAPFSLAGLLVRSPDGADWFFHALGIADEPGAWKLQSNAADDGRTRLDQQPAAAGRAELSVSRIGSAFALLVRFPGGAWQVRRLLVRPDLPDRLQVGLFAAADWPACERLGADEHNRTGAEAAADCRAVFTRPVLHRSARPETLRSRVAMNAEALSPQDWLGSAPADALVAAPPTPGPAPASPAPPESSFPANPLPASPADSPPVPVPTTALVEAGKVDDLAPLSDDFDDPSTLAGWLRVFEVEQTKADQLERFDFGRTRPGWATLVPYSSSWYRDYRGVLVHRRVRGDFMATTRVRTSNRTGDGPPVRPFSLAGIMVRSPRDVTPRSWRPGGENYIFLSLGAADQPGRFQFEVKTTRQSDSQLEISPADAAETLIRVVRIGAAFLLFRRSVEGGAWTLHRRYVRPDMPEELQVGMTVYTDWPTVESTPVAVHNRTVLRTGRPDLVASFDYFHFRRPTMPDDLRRQALANPAAVSDETWNRLWPD